MVKPSRSPMIGESTMNTAIFWRPETIKACHPALPTAAPAIPPTRACDELVGRPRYQVITSQAMAPTSPEKMTALVSTALIDHVLGDRAGHGRSEDQECGEVEERSPYHGQPWRQDASRDDRRDGVGRVVEPVEEIERQGHGDDRHEREVHFKRT